MDELFSDKGCTLIEKRDYSATEKIPYLCPVGHKTSAVVGNFKLQKYRCRYCSLGWDTDQEDVQINRHEEEFLTGLLLGDGNILLVNLARYRHADIHRTYVEKFLPSILPSFQWGAIEIAPERDNVIHGHKSHSKESYYVRTRSYDKPLVPLHKKWYHDEPPRGHHVVGDLKKHVPDDIKLPSRALSTWYEGDGSLEITSTGPRPSGSLSIHLSTNGFCRRCLTTLRERMYEEHELLLTITKNRRMTLNGQTANEFLEKIYPYRSDSYHYKYTAFENWTRKKIYPKWHPTLKTCTLCWTEYPKESEAESDYFVKHGKILNTACKPCKQEVDRAYHRRRKQSA